MISYLKGTILYKLENALVVANNDIGYQVYVPEKKLDRYNVDETIALHTHEHIREDARDLYGFDSPVELDFFLRLIGISGVGPKLALKLFNLGSIEKVKKAVDEENILLLATIPGVGKKTAQKIILELRGKLANHLGLPREDQDVLDALANLGYDRNRIHEILKELPETTKTSEEKIKTALKLLGRKTRGLTP